MNLDLWGDQYEARQQAEISQCARRIGTDAEALANALKRADRDLLETLAGRLIDCDDAETKLALSLFTDSYARTDQ